MIRLHDPGARHRADAAARETAALGVLRGGRYVGGDVVDAFLADLATAMGWPAAAGAASGTDALSLALMAAGLRPGDEVLVPAVSFFATAGAALRLGLRPVPVDVGPELPLLDPEAAAAALGPAVRALVQVPLFGLPLAPIPAGLIPEDIVLIDDQAQAVGSPGLGAAERPARFAALSFYPTKVLGAAGDGGAVLCRSPEDATKINRLGHHGASAAGFGAVAGWTGVNSRLDALQAAVLGVELRSLPARLARRRAHAARLREGLGERLRFVLPPGPLQHNCSVLVALHPDPAAVVAAAAARGVELGRYYARPLSAEPALQGRARLPPCPRAARFCAEALALPCSEDLHDHELDEVIDVLRAVTAALGPHPAAGAAA